MWSLYRPTDEEAEQLLQLMTSRPPATPAGVRFVSLSFCKLLAFPTLVRYIKLVLLTPTFRRLGFIQQTQIGWDHKPNSTNSGLEFGFLPIHAAYQKSFLHLLAFNIVLCYMKCELYPVCVCVCVCVCVHPALQSKNSWWSCGSAGWSKKRSTLRGKENLYIYDNEA